MKPAPIAAMLATALLAASPALAGGTAPTAPFSPEGPSEPRPAAISDQAAAGNLTSFLPTAESDTPCRTTAKGMLVPIPGGCRVLPGREDACRAGGGQLAKSGERSFCIPRAKIGAR
jgi:hypothetical protein